jgi:hypothetical protein
VAPAGTITVSPPRPGTITVGWSPPIFVKITLVASSCDDLLPELVIEIPFLLNTHALIGSRLPQAVSTDPRTD